MVSVGEGRLFSVGEYHKCGLGVIPQIYPQGGGCVCLRAAPTLPSQVMLE